MTVRDLIEVLEELPYDLPVVVESHETEEVVIRDEIYYSAELKYKDGPIVKIL